MDLFIAAVWSGIFMLGLVRLLNEDDIGVVEIFLWSAIGFPICSVFYFILFPVFFLWGLPKYFGYIIKKIIVRT